MKLERKVYTGNRTIDVARDRCLRGISCTRAIRMPFQCHTHAVLTAQKTNYYHSRTMA